MEYTSYSDVNEGTCDLVRQGLASVKRKRVVGVLQPERLHERLSSQHGYISYPTSIVSRRSNRCCLDPWL